MSMPGARSANSKMKTMAQDGTSLAGRTEDASGSSGIRADANMKVVGKTSDRRAVTDGEVRVGGDEEPMPASTGDEAGSLHRVETDRTATRDSEERPSVAQQCAGSPMARSDGREPFQNRIDRKIREGGDPQNKLRAQADLGEKAQESLSDRIQRKIRAQDLMTGRPGAMWNESPNAREVAKERARDSSNERLGRKMKESSGMFLTKPAGVTIAETLDDKIRQKVQKDLAGQASIAGSQGPVNALVARGNMRDPFENHIGWEIREVAKPVATMKDSAITSVVAKGNTRKSFNERISRKMEESGGKVATKPNRAQDNSTGVLEDTITQISQKDLARRETMDRSVSAPVVRSNVRESYEDLIGRKMREAANPQAKLTVDESVNVSEVAKRSATEKFDESWRKSVMKPDRIDIAGSLEDTIREKAQNDSTGQASIAGSQGSVSDPVAISTLRDSFGDRIEHKIKESRGEAAMKPGRHITGSTGSLEDKIRGKAQKDSTGQASIVGSQVPVSGPVAKRTPRLPFEDLIERKMKESRGEAATNPDRSDIVGTLEKKILQNVQENLGDQADIAQSQRSVFTLLARSNVRPSFDDRIERSTREVVNSKATLQDKEPPSIASIKDIAPTKLAHLDTLSSVDQEGGSLGESMEFMVAMEPSPSSKDEDNEASSKCHLDQAREVEDLDASNSLSLGKYDSSSYRLAEAYLVEEGSDSIRDVVIDAYAEPMPPWWKNSRVKALLAAMAVIVTGSAIAVVVTLQSDPLTVMATVAPTISAHPSMMSSLVPSVSQEPSTSPSACALTIVTRKQKLDLSFFNPSKPQAAVDGRNMVTAMIDSKTKSLHVVFYLLKGDEWERVNFLVEMIDANFPAEFSLALSGRKALLGVPFADPFADNFGGLVYVYEQSDRGLWEAKEHLSLQDPSYSHFGHSVDVDGEFAVVGTCDIIGMHDESFYFFRQTQSGWKQIEGIDLPSVKNVLIAEKTIAVSSERIYLYQYDEDLHKVEPLQALSDKALALALSSNYLIYSTKSSRERPKKTHQNELFVYHRAHTNQTYNMCQQLTSDDYEDDFGNSLAFERDLLVVGGNSKTFIFSLQDGSLGQLAVLDGSYGSYQVSGRNLLAMDKSGDVYCFNVEGCAPSPTQVPSLSMPPTVKQSLVPSGSMNPSFLPSLSTIPSMNPSASQSPTISVFSPSTTPTSTPTSIRFLEVIRKLTPLSGEKLVLQGSPQNSAAKWMAGKDPIFNPSTGETGLDLADPRFEQRYIMVLFYFAMDGDNWLQADGWLSSTSECEWFGVHGVSPGCGGEGMGGCVKRSNLDGDYEKICRIDMDFGNGIRGQIPNELGYLSEMRWFKIQYNDLTGTIPDTLGTGWTKLHGFLASNNFMHGGFPETFENNRVLGTVFIDKNRFNSTFPSVFATLKNLEWLRAEVNEFVGELPAGMGNLKSLKILNVTNNRLSGRLPDTWDEANQLEELEVTDNDFTGPLPPSLGNAQFLKDFHASRNQLTGSLPASYYSFQNLEELYLDGNSMAGELPQMDVPFYNGLQELSIHSNGFSGHFPIEHFEETFRLKVLSFHNNQLTGTVTENICTRRDPSRAYTQLIQLTADCDMVDCECCTCYEDGELVSIFSYPTDTDSPTTRPTANKDDWADRVESINRPTKAPSSPVQYRDHVVIVDHIESTVLQRNAVFDGMDESDPRYLALDWILQKDQMQLTTNDKNLPQRYILALIAFSLDSLAWYACGEHRHLGNVTEEFAVEDCEVTNHDQVTERRKVWLSSADECWWYGVICSSDGVVRGLELIDNNLIGGIPPEISQLLLQYLALNNNCLYGTLPPELGQMPYLLSMDLHLNGLSGIFPHEIYDASELQLLNVANQFDNYNECRRSNGVIVNTLYEMGDPSDGYNWGLEGHILGPTVNSWTKMKGLHVSDNSFTGWIDENIGDLNHLVLLQAYNNLLSGSIPHDVSKLKNLRELGLGKNTLEGSLPPYIGQIEDLEELVALENSLTGTMPESLYHLPKLKIFWLSDMTIEDPDAGLGGELSTKIGNLKQLSELYIDSNPLTGTLPTELGSCENLSVLWIHKTKIGGNVPEEVCRLRDKKLWWAKANCLPNNNTQEPVIQCSCCSVCCDHTTDVCITIADD